MITLILGGARSGKSSFAVKVARAVASKQPECKLHYVATAIAFDQEMTRRITHHQQSREAGWSTHESPYELEKVLSIFTAEDVVLVDCLTLWLNNIIFESGVDCDSDWVKKRIRQLVLSLTKTEARVILVSNEIGLGVVPQGEISQWFSLLAGEMNQAIADIASNVILTTAGLPLNLKGDIDA